MTSWWSYWCFKTMKRRPRWFSKQTLWSLTPFSYVNAYFCSYNQICIHYLKITTVITHWIQDERLWFLMLLSFRLSIKYKILISKRKSGNVKQTGYILVSPQAYSHAEIKFVAVENICRCCSNTLKTFSFNRLLPKSPYKLVCPLKR